MFGKFGRSALSPFAARKYARPSWGCRAIDVDLSESIPRRIRLVGGAAPRRVSRSFLPPVQVYVGACGEGNLGVSTHVDNAAYVVHTHAPEWMCGLGIGVLGMAAGLLGLCAAVELFPGQQAILPCDNNGARGIIIRGHSSNAVSRGIAAIFRTISQRANTQVWLEFARSGMNRADGPSRIFHRLKAKNCLPNLFFNILESRESYRQERFGEFSMLRGVREGWMWPH